MDKIVCPICGAPMHVITSYVEVSNEPQYACVCTECNHVEYVDCNDYERS